MLITNVEIALDWTYGAVKSRMLKLFTSKQGCKQTHNCMFTYSH